jgi:hypothetical protein
MQLNSPGFRVAPYIVGILFFVLPFLQVSCDGRTVVRLTGVQLVTGSEMDAPMSNESQKVSPEPFAVIALLALAAGTVFCLSNGKGSATAAAIAGGAAAAALLALKIRMDAQITKEAGGLPLTVDFLMGFWGAVLSALAGLVLSLMRRNETDGGTPATPSAP